MIRNRALQSLWSDNTSETRTFHTTRLTAQQLECLSRCANGISIRFEASEIVDALMGCGYVQRGVAGVLNVTIKGQHYLRTQAS
jgi:hypothetical protein